MYRLGIGKYMEIAGNQAYLDKFSVSAYCKSHISLVRASDYDCLCTAII